MTAPEKKKYIRLPGRIFSLLSTQQLWQGPDHLLWVENDMFQVRYKRFYYQDIQSVVLCRSDRHQIWNSVWGGFALLFGIIAMSVSGTPHVSATLTIACLALLVLNLVMGPACQVQLQTAVQVQHLKSLRRIRTANRVMDRLHDLAVGAQGILQTDQAAPGPKPAKPISPVHAPPVSADQQESLKDVFNPLAHKILFSLMVAMGLLGGLQLGLQGWVVGIIQMMLQVVALIMAITALARYYRPIKGTRVGLLSWFSLVVMVTYTIAGYSIYMTAIIRYPDLTYDYLTLFQRCFELAYFDHPAALAFRVILVVATLIPAALGLLALGRSQSSQTGLSQESEGP